MTGPEHYAEAERLLALADRHTRPFTLMASRFTQSAHLADRQAPIPDLPGAVTIASERRRAVPAYE